MDAATDSVLRSYNPEKSLEEFIQEARDQSGTRYAPYAVDLLRGDELLSELKVVKDNAAKPVRAKQHAENQENEQGGNAEPV